MQTHPALGAIGLCSRHLLDDYSMAADDLTLAHSPRYDANACERQISRMLVADAVQDAKAKNGDRVAITAFPMGCFMGCHCVGVKHLGTLQQSAPRARATIYTWPFRVCRPQSSRWTGKHGSTSGIIPSRICTHDWRSVSRLRCCGNHASKEYRGSERGRYTRAVNKRFQ